MASENVHRLEWNGKQIILVGTAHVSRQSVDEVKELIETEKPDTVCVELCQSRYQSVTDPDRWRNTDIVKIIKDGKSLLLLVNLILSSYQKKLAQQFDIQPGQEMIQGIESARETGAELCLADRDIQVTMLRLWQGMGFWGKMSLLYQVLLSIFVNEEITEEELESMKSGDMLASVLDELSVHSPRFKAILIDERDQYLAQKIKSAPGGKVLAVLGAGHVPGIKEELAQEHDLAQLSAVAPPSLVAKVIGWAIPLLIVALIAFTFAVDRGAGLDQLFSWVLWVGSAAALGTLVVFGHPLSILTAFVAAPFTALHPLLAAGWFAGFTEAMVRKPNVGDFENLGEDVLSLKGFWRNKVTHILLVVVFANLGATFGVVVGGTELIKNFIHVIFG